MARMPHLLVDISAHGYGHATQTAPVVNELARRVPNLRVTVRSAVPEYFLRQRFSCEFRHIPQAFDFGMKMVNAIEVDVAASLAAYRAFHADWDARVARAANEMQALQPDLLLANVPYLSLAAAHGTGVPAVAMCCLNWADVFRHYCAGDAAAPAILGQMGLAYDHAEIFLRVQPGMPMPHLRRVRGIGPIARQGTDVRPAIAEQLPRSVERLVMVAMGGFEYRMPMEDWPTVPGIHWLVPQAWRVARHDMTAVESLGVAFSDALASCDAVVTKPGYSTFAEAACAGVPLLYVSRGDWPEEPFLVEWLRQNGVCLEVAPDRLRRGELHGDLQSVWRMARPPRPSATGASEAADLIQQRYFCGRSSASFCSARNS